MRLAACVLASAGLVALPIAVASAGEDPSATATAKRTHIMCLNKAGTRYLAKYRPRSCAHFGPGGAFAGGVNLRRIRWRSWNRPSVRGRARECGFHEPCSNIRVRIRAYRRRRACGRVVFTRLRATGSFGTTVVRLRRCPSPPPPPTG